MVAPSVGRCMLATQVAIQFPLPCCGVFRRRQNGCARCQRDRARCQMIPFATGPGQILSKTPVAHGCAHGMAPFGAQSGRAGVWRFRHARLSTTRPDADGGFRRVSRKQSAGAADQTRHAAVTRRPKARLCFPINGSERVDGLISGSGMLSGHAGSLSHKAWRVQCAAVSRWFALPSARRPGDMRPGRERCGMNAGEHLPYDGILPCDGQDG